MFKSKYTTLLIAVGIILSVCGIFELYTTNQNLKGEMVELDAKSAHVKKPRKTYRADVITDQEKQATSYHTQAIKRAISLSNGNQAKLSKADFNGLHVEPIVGNQLPSLFLSMNDIAGEKPKVDVRMGKTATGWQNNMIYLYTPVTIATQGVTNKQNIESVYDPAVGKIISMRLFELDKE